MKKTNLYRTYEILARTGATTSRLFRVVAISDVAAIADLNQAYGLVDADVINIQARF